MWRKSAIGFFIHKILYLTYVHRVNIDQPPFYTSVCHSMLYAWKDNPKLFHGPAFCSKCSTFLVTLSRREIIVYCKRPIQCLASSKILTPHPLTARRVCIPLPLVRGKDKLAGWRGGWGINILEDARHSSVLYICKYFVGMSMERGRCSQNPAIQFHPSSTSLPIEAAGYFSTRMKRIFCASFPLQLETVFLNR